MTTTMWLTHVANDDDFVVSYQELPHQLCRTTTATVGVSGTVDEYVVLS